MPRLGQKVLFWILLGMLSTFFAEVTVSSSPFPFFNLWGLLVVFPLYTLHILVLGTLVVKDRRVSFYALFLAGVIFGLYEAYITKVIWDPTWSFIADHRLAEVALPQTPILIFWYHNFFAFIIPLAVAEIVATRSRKIVGSLPPPFSRVTTWSPLRLAIIGGVFFGLIEGMLGLPLLSVSAPLASGLAISGVLYLVRGVGEGPKHTIDELLPQGRELAVLAALLVAMYVVLGAAIMPENIPGRVGQSVVLGIYVLTILLLRKHLGPRVAEGMADSAKVSASRQFTWRLWFTFIAVYAGVAGLAAIVSPVSLAFVVLLHISGTAVGIVIYLRSIVRSASGTDADSPWLIAVPVACLLLLSLSIVSYHIGREGTPSGLGSWWMLGPSTFILLAFALVLLAAHYRIQRNVPALTPSFWIALAVWTSMNLLIGLYALSLAGSSSGVPSEVQETLLWTVLGCGLVQFGVGISMAEGRGHTFAETVSYLLVVIVGIVMTPVAVVVSMIAFFAY